MARAQRYGAERKLAPSIHRRPHAPSFGQPEPAHSGGAEPSRPPRASAAPQATSAAQIVDVTWHRQPKTQGLRAFSMLLDAVVVMHQHDLLAQARREFFEVAEQPVHLPRKIDERT